MIKKYGFALTVYVCVFIGFAFIFSKTIHDGFGLVITSLLLCNSIAVIGVSIIMSYRYGFDIIHTLLMMITYLVSVYVVYNESALVYLIPYVLFDCIGYGIGLFLRRTKQ